jgi:hypothetical protein
MSAQIQSFGQMAIDAMSEIQGISSPPMVESDMTASGLRRLEAAAQGLPVTLDELAAFFASDLQSFGGDEVKQPGIALAVRWYAFTHMNRSTYWWKTDKPKNVVLLDEYRRSIR